MSDPVYKNEFWLNDQELAGMSREEWFQREEQRRAATVGRQLSYGARFNDPRFTTFFTTGMPSQLRPGMTLDPEHEFSKYNAIHTARDMSIGLRDDERHRRFAYSLNPNNPLSFANSAIAYGMDTAKNLASMTTFGSVSVKEDLSLLKGFMKPHEEYFHNRNFRLSNAPRFSSQPDYDGVGNATMEYLIDPVFFRQIEDQNGNALPGKYLTYNSVPPEYRSRFDEAVKTPADALNFFEQLTGELISKELRILHTTRNIIGEEQAPGTFLRDMARDLSTPDMLAEDLLMFGFVNVAGKAIKIGKTALKTRREVHAISKSTGRLVFGDDAVRLLDQGKAIQVTDNMGLMKAAYKTGAVEMVSKKAALAAGGGFAGIELARQEVILQQRNLIQQQETLASGILFAGAMGTVGGAMFRRQVNDGLSSKDIRSIFSAEEAAIEQARKDIASERGVSEFALDDNDLQRAADHGIQAAIEAATELGIKDIEDGLLPSMVAFAEEVKSLPLVNMFQGPGPLLTQKGKRDLPVLSNVIGKISDDMARPDGQRARPFLTEAIQREKETRLHGQNAVRTLDDLEVSILEDTGIVFDDVQKKVAAGQVVGQLTLRPDVEGVTDEVIIEAFNRANLGIDEDGIKLVRQAMSSLREAIRPHVENMVNAGYLNRELTDINPFHVARVWDTTIPSDPESEKGLKTLFEHWVKRNKYAEFIKDMKRSEPEDYQGENWAAEFEGIPDDLSSGMTYENAYQMLREKGLDRYFDTEVDGDVSRALESIRGSIGANERGISDFGAKSYRSRSLGIPNEYEVGGYRVSDYMQTHPQDIVDHMISSTLKPIMTAAKHINSDIPELRAMAAKLLREGNLTGAHNHNVGAQLVELFDLLGDVKRSTRIKSILGTLNAHEENHRAAMEILAVLRPEGDQVRVTEERYSLAEAIVLDALLGNQENSDTFVSRIADLKTREDIAKNQEIFASHSKDYSDFRSKDFKKDEGENRELLRGSPVARALGVDAIVDEGPPSDDLLPEEFRFFIEEPDEYDVVSPDRMPISKDSVILLEASPHSRPTTPLNQKEVDTDDLLIFDSVEAERFGSNQRQGVTTGVKGESPKPERPESPLSVNEPDVLKKRKVGRKVGRQDGRVAWETDQLLTLREAAHTLFFSLTKDARDKVFESFPSLETRNVLLFFSAISKHSKDRALNRSEVFMEAIVESLATGGRLDNFAKHFTSLNQEGELVLDSAAFNRFRKIIKEYSWGFSPENPKTKDFLGNRKVAQKDLPGAQAARADLEETLLEQGALKSHIKDRLETEFGRYDDGRIGRGGQKVDPMGEDEAFVHGRPGQNISEMIQAVAKSFDLPPEGPARTSVLTRVGDALSEFVEEGTEIADDFSAYYRSLDESRRVYEASVDDFSVLRDVAHKGYRKYNSEQYMAFHRNLRKGKIGEGANDTARAYLEDGDDTMVVPRILSRFDSQSAPLEKRSLQESIVEDGVAAARRAELFHADRVRAWKEYVDTYGPQDKDGLEAMAEELDNFILAVQGRGKELLNLSGKSRPLRMAGQALQKAISVGETYLYAKYSPIMMMTQLLDIVNSVWAVGLGPLVLEMAPALAKEFLAPDILTKSGRIRRRLADSRKVPFIEDYLLKRDGTFGKSFADIFDELTVDEKLDFFLDTFGRSALTAAEVIADPKLERALINNPRTAKRNGNGTHQEQSNLMYLLQKAGYFNTKFNSELATAFIAQIPSRVLRASHKVAKRLMLESLSKAAKEISAPWYREVMDMNLSAKDFSALLETKKGKLLIKDADDLSIAVLEGRVSQEAFDKIDAFGVDRFFSIVGDPKKGKRSKHLDRMRMIGFRDHEIISLSRAIDEAGGNVDDIPQNLLDLFNTGRMKFSNNMNPVPTDASVPALLKNEIGRSVFVFLRFLTTVSSTFGRIASRRGGGFALAEAQAVSMAMMAAVEEVKLALKGQQDESGLGTFRKIVIAAERGELPELSKKEKSYLLKILNGSGQMGPLPEMLAAHFSTQRFGRQTMAPTMEMFEAWKTGEITMDAEGAANLLDAIGLGTLETVIKTTKGLRE